MPAPAAIDPLSAGDDLVEIVEGAERDQPHDAALRRLRVDVVEMLEACRIFELAEQRQAVPPVGRLAVGVCADARRAEERHCQIARGRGTKLQERRCERRDRRVRRKETSGAKNASHARIGRIMPDFTWLGHCQGRG